MKTKTYEDNHFVSKEPCPECGSRDNLARYSDGHAYCFGCGHREPAKTDWDKIESMVAKAYNKLEVVPLEKMTAIYRGMRGITADTMQFYNCHTCCITISKTCL